MMQTPDQRIDPVAPKVRIVSLDLLRGIAVLGILIMNIQSLSMIGAAYMNPMAYGDMTGVNKWVWMISHVLASEKFMSIFSMLFGAGVLLFTGRAVDKGRRPGPLHYRRMLWLLLFGLMHAYLIWYGDILVAYSLCGMLMFVFRKMKPAGLLTWAVVFFVIPPLMSVMSGMSMDFWPQESVDQTMESWKPAGETVAQEIEAMRGGWLEQMDVRVPMGFFMQTFLFFWSVFWRVTSMMLLGMALFKLGILSAEKSRGFYLRMILIGLIPGILISGWGVHINFSEGWSLQFSMFIGSQFNYVASVLTALGYIGLVMLLARSVCCSGVKRVFSAVGRMAFTNYILMSLLGMFIFYGNGLGLYGQVSRIEQIYIMAGIWVVILVISPLWLKYFRFGPLEWLWRVLTYWHYQPMKKVRN